MRQVGRAAHQFRQQRRERFDGVLRGLARGDHRALGLHLGDVRIGLGGEIGRQLAGCATLQLRGLLRILGGIGVEQRIPLGFQRLAGLDLVPAGIDVGGDLERTVRPFQRSARGVQLFLAQRRAVAGLLAGLVRRTEADRGAAADQRGLVGSLQCGVDGGLDLDRVVAVDVAHHLPAIGLEAGGRVVGEPAVGVAVDGDLVVVPEADQLAQSPGAGERGGLVRDAFHQAAVAHEDEGAVIDEGVAFTVEALRQQLLGQREADRIREALAQRAGGGFHARGLVALRVAGGLAVQLAEVLQLLQRQVVAGQVQQRVLQHRAVAVGQDETVAVEPVRVRRAVAVVVVPQHFGDVGHAHGHAGMAGIGGLYRVGGEETDGVGELAAGGRRHGSRSGGGGARRAAGPPLSHPPPALSRLQGAFGGVSPAGPAASRRPVRPWPPARPGSGRP